MSFLSFFKDNKKAGIAFMILGLVNLVSGVISIVGILTAEGEPDYHALVGGIGPVIMAVLYFYFGRKVATGQISRKIDILATLVRLAGLEMIITSAFNAVNAVSDENWGSLLGIAGAIIVGLASA